MALLLEPLAFRASEAVRRGDRGVCRGSDVVVTPDVANQIALQT